MTGVEDRMMEWLALLLALLLALFLATFIAASLRRLQQQHEGVSPDGNNPEITSTPEKTSQKPITGIWWIPLIPLASFPLFFFALSFTGLIQAYYSAYIADILLELIFVACFLLVLCSPILVPIYAIYLVRNRRWRIENGEWNLFIAMFHLLSFISAILVLLVFLMLASALGGA